jgi:hypothetical protein
MLSCCGITLRNAGIEGLRILFRPERAKKLFLPLQGGKLRKAESSGPHIHGICHEGASSPPAIFEIHAPPVNLPNRKREANGAPIFADLQTPGKN